MLLAAALLGAAPALADQGDIGTPVTDPAAIRNVMVGNTLGGVFEETGEAWAEYYCDTGKSLYDFRGTISLGKWWVEKSQVCFTYDWSDYQHVQCFAMYEAKDRTLNLVAQDDAGARLMTFHSDPPLPGDPYHLEQRATHGCQPEPSV
ncbi:MAG TPA: hypothetical protein VMT54_15015 [Candidatus Cybelea sp.]|nr:hypothetical protein [Candidatus Cybelea sp.]